MSEKVLVLSTMRFVPELLDRLRAVDARLEVAQDVRLEPYLDRVEVVYGWRLLPQPEQAPRLRWIQLHTAGADRLLGSGWLGRSEVAITNNSGIHSGPMAEFILTLILAWRRHLPRMVRDQLDHRWPRERWALYARPELRGSTLGILGYGSIGRQLAYLARAFGMRVLALKRDPRQRRDRGYRDAEDPGDPQGTIPEAFYGPEDRLEMLSRSDIVVSLLPLNEETRGLIGRQELRAMKPDAFLVNVARGEVVHEEALLEALDQGWIGGAGLDVFGQEPLPADHPLWGRQNVILSPHVAGFSPGYDERASRLFAANLRRYLEGQPLLNLIHRQLAY